MTRALSILFLASLCFTATANGQQAVEAKDTSLFAAGATPKLVSRQFRFTEGPATDKAGNVYFTDQPNNKIWKWSTDGSLTVFMDSAGRSNGMDFDKKGRLVACADEHNQLWRIKKNGKVKILLKDYNGKLFNGPNDVWVHPGGGIYFTDPYYHHSYWTRKGPELDNQAVFYLGKRKKKAVPVIDTLKKPNGIMGTPDGKWLYVGDIGAGKTYKYSIKKDGSLGVGEFFAAVGSDGMAIDEKGNVYLTGNGITVVNPQGQQIAHIAVPENWTGSVTFCGKDRNQLFITAYQGFYIMDMKVKGAR
jgi:gluconolactonase